MSLYFTAHRYYLSNSQKSYDKVKTLFSKPREIPFILVFDDEGNCVEAISKIKVSASPELYHSGAVIYYNGYEVGKVFHNISATAALEKLQPFLDDPGLCKKCAEITREFFEACVRDHQAKEAARKKSEQKERQAADKLDQYFR